MAFKLRLCRGHFDEWEHHKGCWSLLWAGAPTRKNGGAYQVKITLLSPWQSHTLGLVAGRDLEYVVWKLCVWYQQLYRGWGARLLIAIFLQECWPDTQAEDHALWPGLTLSNPKILWSSALVSTGHGAIPPVTADSLIQWRLCNITAKITHEEDLESFHSWVISPAFVGWCTLSMWHRGLHIHVAIEIWSIRNTHHYCRKDRALGFLSKQSWCDKFKYA